MFNWLNFYFRSSIGQKQLLAISGFCLGGFLAVHLLGNTLIFVGPDAFNMYAHKLTSTPLIYLAEVMLVGLFLFHVSLAVYLTLLSRKARPVPYAVTTYTGRGSTFTSRTMIWTGSLIFIFLIIHLLYFKYGEYIPSVHEGLSTRDLYKLVVIYFKNPLNIALYLFFLLTLLFHLWHGFSSAFQTLGIHHLKYTFFLETFSRMAGFILAMGFIVFPFYCYFFGAIQ